MSVDLHRLTMTDILFRSTDHVGKRRPVLARIYDDDEPSTDLPSMMSLVEAAPTGTATMTGGGGDGGALATLTPDDRRTGGRDCLGERSATERRTFSGSVDGQGGRRARRHRTADDGAADHTARHAGDERRGAGGSRARARQTGSVADAGCIYATGGG